MIKYNQPFIYMKSSGQLSEINRMFVSKVAVISMK